MSAYRDDPYADYNTRAIELIYEIRSLLSDSIQRELYSGATPDEINSLLVHAISVATDIESFEFVTSASHNFDDYDRQIYDWATDYESHYMDDVRDYNDVLIKYCSTDNKLQDGDPEGFSGIPYCDYDDYPLGEYDMDYEYASDMYYYDDYEQDHDDRDYWCDPPVVDYDSYRYDERDEYDSFSKYDDAYFYDGDYDDVMSFDNAQFGFSRDSENDDSFDIENISNLDKPW